MDNKHNELFNDILNPPYYETIAERQARERKTRDFEKTELKIIQHAEEENEKYDAIHRTRGLLSPKDIYVLCVLGKAAKKKIDYEFNYQPIKEDEIEDLLKVEHDPRTYLNLDFDNIIELIKLEKSNTKIAQELHIKKNGNYDTKLIKHIRAYVTQKN